MTSRRHMFRCVHITLGLSQSRNSLYNTAVSRWLSRSNFVTIGVICFICFMDMSLTWIFQRRGCYLKRPFSYRSHKRRKFSPFDFPTSNEPFNFFDLDHSTVDYGASPSCTSNWKRVDHFVPESWKKSVVHAKKGTCRDGPCSPLVAAPS